MKNNNSVQEKRRLAALVLGVMFANCVFLFPNIWLLAICIAIAGLGYTRYFGKIKKREWLIAAVICILSGVFAHILYSHALNYVPIWQIYTSFLLAGLCGLAVWSEIEL